MSVHITVLGTGYLGATHAACLAELGFDVLGLDTNEAQVEALAAGRLPFHEPELQKLLEAGLRSGRLRFSTSYEDAAAFGDVHFVCVGTPQRPDSDAADLSHLMTCIDALAPLLDPALPGCRQVHRSGRHRRDRRRTAGCRSHPPGQPPRWPGTRSSCARATRSPTRCGRTGSWSGSARRGRGGAARGLCRARWRPGCRSW